MDYYNFNFINSVRTQPQASSFAQCSQYDFGNNYNIQLSNQNYDPEVSYQFSNLMNSKVFLKPVDVDEIAKTDDELWVETWLSKIGKIHINLDSVEEIQPVKKKRKATKHGHIQIHTAKHYLKHCFYIIQKLQQTYNVLQNHVATMSSAEWKRKTVEIGTLKDELSSLMSNFDNSATIKMLRKAVEMRKKKRKQQKQRKIEHREHLKKQQEEKNKIHTNIDQWLLNMKDAVDRAKMEENMRKDADCVLYEVNKKKSDARKQLSLLSALMKLRSVREQAALQKGQVVSLEDRNAFASATDKLTEAWENSLKVYAKEEKGLKMMLDQTATNDSIKKDKERKLIQEWDIVLFGQKHVPTPAYWGLTAAEKNFETFVAIRKSWDTFLVPHENPEGCKIPVGWILPSSSASEGWTKHLQQE